MPGAVYPHGPQQPYSWAAGGLTDGRVPRPWEAGRPAALSATRRSCVGSEAGGAGEQRTGCPGMPGLAPGTPMVAKAHTLPLLTEGGCYQQGCDRSAGQNH